MRQGLPAADAAGDVLPVRAVRRALLLLGAGPLLAGLVWWAGGTAPPSAGALAWLGALWLGWTGGVAWLLRRSRRAEAVVTPAHWMGTAAHALRNRLAALGGATELLAVPDAAPALRARAHAIAALQLRHLADLAGNLAELAELAEAGAPGAHGGPGRPLDLATLALAALDTQRPAAAAAGQLLLHATQPAPVLGEARALEQAVAALLRHGLGQLPVGAALVLEVRAQACEAVLRLRSDRSALVPTPQRAAPPTDDPDMGLVLAQSTVARHGGRLSIAAGAEPDIELRLPLHSGASAGTRPRAAAGLRLLLVEDVAGVRDSLAAQLRGEGHAVSAQPDGEAGLRSLLAEWPDAAVVDLSLPGLSACALARSARRAGYAGRMVAIAGYEPSPERAEALRAGFDACVNKPVRTSQLRQLLASRG
ncbi:hypothetical protein GCM10007320_28960 [Pseudorhodoferax aquiterrae]|uniref:Response regulator n=1 Tax=Pseudorhodoferax aquiterrae TaxID=747304 RepID=A0ABQ3G2Y2_9BURK|nr:response regulator [Pseudorhodoferax aquiterrae]GHC84492.1 hypothetical protein GCM10007320_28960 [Pseudorhodoferax aquiterrae]